MIIVKIFGTIWVSLAAIVVALFALNNYLDDKDILGPKMLNKITNVGLILLVLCMLALVGFIISGIWVIV